MDNLANLLFHLDRSAIAIDDDTVSMIKTTFSELDPRDKDDMVEYTAKHRSTELSGPWNVTRKRSGTAPSIKAAER